MSGGHLSAQPGANYLTFLSLHPALNHPLFTFFFQVQTQTSSVSYQTIPKCCRKDALNELHKDLIQMQLQRKENIGKHFFLGGGGGGEFFKDILDEVHIFSLLKGKLGEIFLSAQSFYLTLTKRSFNRQF